MRLEYTKILDEMAQNDNMIQHMDGRNLLTYLQVHGVIDYQKRVRLENLGPKESILHLISDVLKPRKDENMTHLLNSLQEAKYDDAFYWLKEKLDNISLTNQHQSVQYLAATTKPITDSDKKNALANIATVFYGSFHPFPSATILLQARMVFSPADVETIRMQPTQPEKIYEFLRIIQSRQNWFEELLKVLEDTGQHDLLVRLKNELPK